MAAAEQTRAAEERLLLTRLRNEVTLAQRALLLRREALRTACTKLCGAGDEPGEACASRCAVDVEAGKIGARTTCTGEP